MTNDTEPPPNRDSMAGAAADLDSTSSNFAHLDDAHDKNSQPPAPKKRRAANTSRGVANLTPEQLARKRANDREAQRAIRERTKTEIERLHQEIRELKNQQPYHDLQLVIRQKDAILAENAEIRKRLESVMNILQPLVRATAGPNGGLEELAAAAERSPLSVAPAPSQAMDTRAFHSTLGEMAASASAATHNGGIDSFTDDNRLYGFPGDAPTSHMRRWPGDDERMGVDFLLESNAQRRAVDPNLPPPRHQQPSPLGTAGPVQHAPSLIPHATLPPHLPSTCPLDTILLDFLAERQAQMAAGDLVETVIGPTYPNFTAIVHPDRSAEAHALSKLLTGILRTFPDVSGIPEQVAVLYMMFLITRWQIHPSQENYDRLPDWITPRPSQLFVAHPVWYDYIPWPRLRDIMITSQPQVPFDTFFIPFTTTMSVNWPHSPRSCLIPASPTANEQWLINPAFESHLRDLSNWSLGPNFRTAFPTFANAVRIKE